MTCQFETPAFIYYSYIAAIILSFATALLVLFRNKKCSVNRNAFYFISIITLYILNDFLQWTIHDAEINLFLYKTSSVADAIFLFFAYFAYDFVEKPLSIKNKILLAIPFFLEIPLVFSSYGTRIININVCDFADGPLSFYSYIIETLYVILATVVLLKKYKKADFIFKYQTKVILLSIWFLLESLLVYWVTWSTTLLSETSLYFMISTLFSIFLFAFAVIKADLFDFETLPRDWFMLAIMTAIFIPLVFFSVSLSMALIVIAIYSILVFIFWKM